MCEAAMRAVDWVVAMPGIDRCPPAQWTCQLRVTLVPAAQLRGERPAATGHGEAGGETAQTHAAEGERAEHKAAAPSESHRELRLLGTDIEAVPFVVLAALVSVALAALGYARPRWLPGLVAIAVAMTLFGVVDVREAFHQSDENQTGLAILASVIAALHFAAAGLAVALAARRGNPESPGTAGTIPV